MPDDLVALPESSIENCILLIRGHKVILDRELARLYGVSTRTLNQAVKRNLNRFPDDFMFQLTHDETAAWQETSLASSRSLKGPFFKITNCDLKKSGRKTHKIPALRLHRTRHPDAFERAEERPCSPGQYSNHANVCLTARAPGLERRTESA